LYTDVLSKTTNIDVVPICCATTTLNIIKEKITIRALLKKLTFFIILDFLICYLLLYKICIKLPSLNTGNPDIVPLEGLFKTIVE